LSAFSGSEFVETFDDQTDGFLSNPFTLNGITYTSSDRWRIQDSSSSLFDNIPGASLAPTLNTDGPAGFPTNITIDFSTLVTRAGLLLSGAGGGSTWDVTAYGVGLALLETITVSQPNPDDAVFAGIERYETIVRLGIVKTAGDDQFHTFMDDIRIEANDVSVIPLPAALPLFLSALGVLSFMGWRKQRT
jgi:hypothetical protein